MYNFHALKNIYEMQLKVQVSWMYFKDLIDLTEWDTDAYTIHFSIFVE